MVAFGRFLMETPGAILGMIHSGILGGDGTPGVQDGDGMQAGAGTVGPGIAGAGEEDFMILIGRHTIEDRFTL